MAKPQTACLSNSSSLGMIFVVLYVMTPAVVSADEPVNPLSAQDMSVSAQTAATRGLAFLRKDAEQWKETKKCASCHHGVMTLWALNAAQKHLQGVELSEVNEATAWNQERLEKLDAPRSSEPGFNLVNSAAISLGMMAVTLPSQTAISKDDMQRIAGHLLRHQETNGSWAWSIGPRKNLPPPVFESDEVLTLKACIILSSIKTGHPEQQATIGESLKHAEKWLATIPHRETTQAAALRLFRQIQAGSSLETTQLCNDDLLRQQNADGGWGQTPDLASDGYATGQALYFLSFSKSDNALAARENGRKFLVATQLENGAWPMVSHAHAGEQPFTDPVPITYVGSAWATLGLLKNLHAEQQN